MHRDSLGFHMCSRCSSTRCSWFNCIVGTVLVVTLQEGVHAIQRECRKKNHQDIGCNGSLQFKERLGLFSLGYGMHRGDLVEVYRILTGKHRIDSQNPFFKGRGRLELDEFQLEWGNLTCKLITQRVLPIWAKLPKELVDANTITKFKQHLDVLG